MMLSSSQPSVLQALVEGNQRFCAGQTLRPPSLETQRLRLVGGQNPAAVVLTCADSRVDPALIFDQSLGDLFVIRVAGNIVDDAVLGSIEYAVAALDVPLIVVMGHQACGAVQAALADDAALSPHLDELARAIQPAVDRARRLDGDLLTNAICCNAKHVADKLAKHTDVLGPRVSAGELEVRAAYYEFNSGRVTLLEADPATESPRPPRREITREMAAAAHPALHQAEMLFNAKAESLEALVFEVLAHLEQAGRISGEERRQIAADLGKTPNFAVAEDLGHGVGVVRIPVAAVEAPRVSLARCASGRFEAADEAPIRFVWVVFGPDSAEQPDNDELEPFGWMLIDDRFSAQALGAAHDGTLVDAYEQYLDFIEHPERSRPVDVPEELQRVGGVFGGVLADVRRRAAHYGSDFTDGFNGKTIASALFLFFACLAPAVAFGGLLTVLTEGQLGAIEMIVATTVCGIVYALTAGQPLTILGSTGPVIIFMGIIYQLCRSFSLPYFPTLCWIGLWTTLILVLLAATEVSRLIRFFTRFTDEIFAALISAIFVVEALTDAFKGFTQPGVPHDTALLSLILAIGTYMIAQQLSRFRRSVYLRAPVREFLADFGPAIAIAVMTTVAVWLHPVQLDTLAVPDTITTTSGRPWLVDPFEAPRWVWGASLVPAILVSVLLYLDQNITVRLVNDRRYKLKKGAGYHLDLLILGLLVGACSLFGLPWMVAATVRSLNHVRSLADVESHGGEEQLVRVRETRVSSLVVHLMIAGSLLILPLLSEVPMSVLFGLFLYMGVASLRNNQFFHRLRLWFTDPHQYPPTHYVRRVPIKTVHLFTAIQLACLAILWLVKTSVLGILFPLFIALLVPVRLKLGGFFTAGHLAYLDAEEDPEEEGERDLN